MSIPRSLGTSPGCGIRHFAISSKFSNSPVSCLTKSLASECIVLVSKAALGGSCTTAITSLPGILRVECNSQVADVFLGYQQRACPAPGTRRYLYLSEND